MKNNNFLNKQAGISLIEIILVIVAIGFLVMIIANLPSATAAVTRNRHISLARDIASREIENLRKQGYANLAIGSSSFVDPNLTNLNSGTGTVNIEDCPEQTCTLGELAKIITVQVKWNEQGDNKQVEVTTLISEGGIGH